MTVGARKIPHQFGTKPVGITRYFALYAAQIGWCILGYYLLTRAVWPSSCMPTTPMRFVTCSIHLPDNRGWIESALMTWLWSTPMLVGLEISRRAGLARETRSADK